MLSDCPECKKSVSDTASACPSCGHVFAVGEVARQRRKKKGDEQASLIAGLITLPVVVGIMVWLCSEPAPSKSTSPLVMPASTPYVPAPTPTSSYVTDAIRQQEIGQKSYPTRGELREYLILDAKQAVCEGSMSRSDFEQWTGERFPK